jgi:hypothetical protein
VSTEPLATRQNEPRPDSIAFATAERVEVDLDPSVATFSRRRRAPDEVGEHRDVPVSDGSLGYLRVRCDPGACNTGDLRESLRIAAGALGVSDLAEVTCREGHGELSCAALLAVHELDPERDPSAR